MLSPFDIAKNIFQKQPKLSDEVIESNMNVWMVLNILSSDQNMCMIANELNKNGYTKKMVYDCLYYGIPKTSKFIPYNAKKEKAEKEVQYIMEYFQCSQQTAKQYSVLISDEEKKEIISFFEDRGVKK